MKIRKIVAAGLLFCMSASVLCACGEQQQEMADKVYVGVTCYNQSDTFLGELLDCFKEQMDELETDELETIVTVRDAEGAQRTQNDQVRELIKAGCNVHCDKLVDREGPSEVIGLDREDEGPISLFNGFLSTNGRWRGPITA